MTVHCTGISRSVRGTSLRRRAAAKRERPAQRFRQRRSHSEHGVGGGHQHHADCDRPYRVAPDVRLPSSGPVGSLAPIEDQRNQYPPREHTAGDVDERVSRPDDVADADQRGRQSAGVDQGTPATAAERSEAFDVFAEDLQSLVALQELDQSRQSPWRRRCSAVHRWPLRRP